MLLDVDDVDKKTGYGKYAEWIQSGRLVKISFEEIALGLGNLTRLHGNFTQKALG